MRAILIALFIAGIAGTSVISSQSTYDTSTIYLQSWTYVKNGQQLPYGFMRNKLGGELQVSPDAVVEFDRYRKKYMIGYTLVLAGTGMLLGSIFSENSSAQIGLGVGAAVGILTGTAVRSRASDHLQKSVWLYNRDAVLTR